MRPSDPEIGDGRHNEIRGRGAGAGVSDAGQDADDQPGPARRPISRSASESPTTAVRAGSTPSRAQSSRTMSGAGFTATPSSAHRRSRRSGRSGLERPGLPGRGASSLVATAIRRPPVRRRRNSPSRSAKRTGQADRVRGVPRPAMTWSAAGPVKPAPTRSGAFVHEGEPSASRLRPLTGQGRWSPDRSRVPRTGLLGLDRRAGRRRFEICREVHAAQPPHIASNSMSVPSLSKMTRSIPDQVAAHPSASGSTFLAASLSVPRPARSRLRAGSGRSPSRRPPAGPGAAR